MSFSVGKASLAIDLLKAGANPLADWDPPLWVRPSLFSQIIDLEHSFHLLSTDLCLSLSLESPHSLIFVH
jgi:hypothetical protein